MGGGVLSQGVRAEDGMVLKQNLAEGGPCSPGERNQLARKAKGSEGEQSPCNPTPQCTIQPTELGWSISLAFKQPSYSVSLCARHCAWLMGCCDEQATAPPLTESV